MRLSVLQEDLSQSIVLASRFTSSKAQLPILANVLLKTEKGKLVVEATNLESGIRVSLGAKVEEEGQITIPAKIITDLVTHLPAGRVELSLEKDQLKVQANTFTASIAGIPAQEFPHIPDKAPETAFVIKKGMLDLLTKQVTFAAALDDTRPILTGVCVLAEGDHVIAVATDGFRMSYKELGDFKFKEKDKEGKVAFLLPARMIEELGRALGKADLEINVGVSPKEGQIIFDSPDMVITSRFIEGEFPDYNRVMPKAWTTQSTLGKDELLRAVKATSVFARESSSIVKVSFTKDGLTLMAESNQYGKEEVTLDAKTEGEETIIAFNYKYLIDFLNSIAGTTVIIQTQGPTTPGVFQDPTDPTYKHIIMPVRVQG